MLNVDGLYYKWISIKYLSNYPKITSKLKTLIL
jgi:hypothetical protein